VDSLQRLPGVVLVIATAVALSALAPANAAAADPVVYAAGDIACAPGDQGSTTTCHERQTSDIVLNGGASRALALGDLQYDSASLSNLQNSYDHTWGRFKSITSPSLGNHEGSGSGYFDYFYGSGVNTGPYGTRGKGFYSFDIGAWHLIALNSNCSRVPCAVGSEQEGWLRADLAAHPNACTLAFWHHPRFSSGHDGDGTFVQPLWQALYDANADLALVGHSHDYERFAPQNASGALDRTRGIRQFVVGTGGAFFTGMSSAKPNSEVRQNNTFGVLKLTLHATSYDWQFVPEAGKTFTDAGSEACHGGGISTPPPDPGSTVKVPAEADARVSESSPGTNYGSDSYLRADGGSSSDVDSYLKFSVSGLSGAIQSAKLRVYAYSGTANGPAVFSSATGWSESAITWSSRPATTSGATDDKGSITSNSWVEYDVSSFVTGNGTYSFRLATTSSDGVDFRSSEYSDATRRPELVLSVSQGTDTQAPDAPTDLSANAAGSTQVDLSWSASTDNVGVTAYEIYRNGSLLATTTGTGHSDTTVSPNTTYGYQVRALDAAGNRSAFSNTATLTTPSGSTPSPSTLKLSPEADARTAESSPSTNYGGSYLRANGGSEPDVDSYLKFTVGGLSGPVQSAKLRIYAYSGTANGPAVFSTATGWSESAITWANRPATTSGATDDKGAIASGSWVEYDVSSFVTGSGTYSFRLATTSSDGVDIYSREHTEATRRPELVLTLGT
jgi:chitodextrinase